MYAQHVRKWSLKTQPQLMPLISLAIYVSNMLLLITCAPTTTAAATTTTTQRQQQLQQQRLWESEESSYYIALPQQQQQQQQLADNGRGSSESVGISSRSNIDNNILSRLFNRPSNSLSSTSNIKLRPATVFDAAVQQQQQQQQHIAAVTTQQSQQQQVPNTLINSQIYKLLYNGMPSVSTSSKTRRHAQQQQQQQQLSSSARQQQQPATAAAYNNSSNTARAATAITQRYLIESYEVPESIPTDPTARNRRDFGNNNNNNNSQRQHRSNAGGYRKQQQQERREERSQRQQQRQHSSQQQQQQRRKHPGKHRRYKQPYCSAHDPAQLAYAAPTVFRGVFTSMTADRRANFSATMKVLYVYKQQRDLQLPQLVRLQFALSNSSGECDIYQEQLLPRGLVRRNKLEQSSDISYMMFVQQTNPGNFSILGQPKRVTARVLKSVQKAVNETYGENGQELTSTSTITPSNATMQNGDELRIICEVRGEPPPKVTWFKDDKSINRKRRVYQFKHFKRRSVLIVRSFNGSTDAGKYECRAKNKASKTIDKRRIMINAHLVPMRPDQHSMGYGYPCELENICFHGGTCMIIPDLTQFYCNCPEGFNGVRCEFSRPDSTYFVAIYGQIHTLNNDYFNA
ncbi:GH17034 [Drosophila grimshawi]|uniref:GH17034 n=1 Tax=Drosophila grimshawi TaxID=7222 RepID=B4IZG8_DROGR|nr:GH17034 [Drosophila grimshawi]